MTYKCGICKKEMLPVDDISLKKFLVKGWRCECGQTYSNPEDVDKIVRYLRTLNMEAIPDEFLSKIRDLPFVVSIEFGEFYDGANVLVNLSEMNMDTEKKIHEMEYDLAQNFGGYVSILVLPVKDL
jgi:hypothetical protein